MSAGEQEVLLMLDLVRRDSRKSAPDAETHSESILKLIYPYVLRDVSSKDRFDTSAAAGDESA